MILATRRGKNAKTDSSENKVTCIEWQPSEGHKKIAAGFLDGMISFMSSSKLCNVFRISSSINRGLDFYFYRFAARYYCCCTVHYGLWFRFFSKEISKKSVGTTEL